MIDVYGAIERAVLWAEGRPSIIAWLMGWFAAMVVAQMAKQILPLGCSHRRVRLFVQTIAIVVGAGVAFMLWPETTPHGVVYAIVIGMSAPQAYSGIKALVCWRLPGLAYRLSWDRVRDRKQADAYEGKE